jgi:hypothetical protein
MKRKQLVLVTVLLLSVLMSSCIGLQGGYYGGYNRYNGNRYGYSRPYIRVVPRPIIIAPRYGYGGRGGYGGGGHHHGRRRW